MPDPTLFELRSLPLDRSKGRIFLIQLPYKTERLAAVEMPTSIASLEGASLKSAGAAIAEIIGRPDLPLEHASIDLTEEQAVRVALICNVAGSTRSSDKIKQVAEGVAAMPLEKAAYWLAELSADMSENGRRALMVLLTGSL